MKYIAIIPARGGSVGLPKKNTLPFHGKPLIAWTIQAALSVPIIEEVYVSTDDDTIASISESYGAKIIKRPAEISSSNASSESALIHALSEIGQFSELPEAFLFLQCTSPLMSTLDITTAIENFKDQCADVCFTASLSHKFMWKTSTNGSAKGINHDSNTRLRRQDRKAEYQENGAVYVLKTKQFLEKQHRFFGKTVISEMPNIRSLEIDTEEDFKIAEAVMSIRLKDKLPQKKLSEIRALAIDFDGVMTNNQVIVCENGTESVVCNRSDGWGISQLKKAGLKTVVLSTESNNVVKVRCKKLKIECQNSLGENKHTAFSEWCHKHKLDPKQVAFIGNDSNDLNTMQLCGLAIAPSDANEEVKGIADLLLNKKGGEGAVREACDLLIRSRYERKIQ